MDDFIGRIVIAIAAIFFAVEFFLHPEFVHGFPLEKITPSWVPLPSLWGYLTGAILLAAGIGLALNQKISDGRNLDWRTDDRLHSIPVSLISVLAHGRITPAILEAMNYVFDTLLYAGTALAWHRHCRAILIAWRKRKCLL
jgi:hypothetical protein